MEDGGKAPREDEASSRPAPAAPSNGSGRAVANHTVERQESLNVVMSRNEAGVTPTHSPPESPQSQASLRKEHSGKGLLSSWRRANWTSRSDVEIDLENGRLPAPTSARSMGSGDNGNDHQMRSEAFSASKKKLLMPLPPLNGTKVFPTNGIPREDR
eukprot:207351-Rhodomonas_salina.1